MRDFETIFGTMAIFGSITDEELKEAQQLYWENTTKQQQNNDS